MAGKKPRPRRGHPPRAGRGRAERRQQEQRWMIIDIAVRTVGIFIELLRR